MPGMLTRPAAGVRLRIPPGWWELPLLPDGREAAIADIVSHARPELPEERRRQLAARLTTIAGAAHREGAVFCAQAVMTDGDGHLVPASVVISPVSVRLRREALPEQAAAMARRGFPRASDPWPAGCGVVTLPLAGPAVRVRSDPRSGGPDPTVGLDSLRLQFFIPVPGADATAVVSFSYPVLTGEEPADDLVQLFDAMAGTLRFVDAQGQAIPPPPEP